jgi:hypothetical protein
MTSCNSGEKREVMTVVEVGAAWRDKVNSEKRLMPRLLRSAREADATLVGRA